MGKGKLFVISGASGVGKSTVLAKVMAERKDLTFSVSATTRAPRDGEVEGVSYYFVTHEKFRQMIENDEFVEYDRHNAACYGTPLGQLEEKLEKGSVILDIEPNGAFAVRKARPDATLVFLVPPTWDDLEVRIHNSKFIPESEIAERLEIAKEEVLCADQYDYILINDTLEDTVRRFAQIVHGNRYSRNSMKSFLKSYIESEIKSELVDMIRSL